MAPSTSRIFPLFLRLSSFRAPLFSPCKYAPSKSHKDLYSQREPSSPSNATHQEGYHLPLPFPFSLSLSPLFSLFFSFFSSVPIFIPFSFFLLLPPRFPSSFSVYLCRRLRSTLYVPRDFRTNYEIKGLLRGLWRWRARPRCENTVKFVVKDEMESNHFRIFGSDLYSMSVFLFHFKKKKNLNIFQFNIISF